MAESAFFSDGQTREVLSESMSKPQNSAKSQEKAQNKQKINPLKPSMRDKERYMAFEIKSNEPLGYNADKELSEQIRILLGVFLSPKANITIMKYNPEKQRGILRVTRQYVEHVRSCFLMIKNINNKAVLIRTLRVSGMIHKVKEYLD